MIRIVKNYTFTSNAANDNRVTFTDFTSVEHERIIRIYNITRNITLYEVNPTNFISTGSTVSGNVFTSTLSFATQNSGDLIHIEYDDPSFDLPITPVDGNKIVTTAGTRVAIASTATPCKSVVITAGSANTGTIVVGASTVVASLASRRGTPLDKGDSCVIDIDDLSKLFIDSTVSGEGITYTLVK